MEKQYHQLTGAALLLIGTFAFSAQTIIVKYAGQLLTVWQISFARWFLGALSMAIVAFLFRVNIMGRNRLGLTLRGIMSTSGFILLVMSIQILPVSEANALFFSFPAWSALLSQWVNREPTPKLDWILICGAFTGACLILLTDYRSLYVTFYGRLFALSSGFCIGLSMNLVRRLRTFESDNNAFSIYFYLCLVGSVVSIGPLIIQKPSIIPIYPGLILLAILAVLALLAQLSLGMGLKHISAHRGGVIQMLQVVIVGIFGVAFFYEALTIRLLVGSALIVGCGVVLTLRTE
jgi:drug/metabolite transporter (DMT)-like permease